MFRSFPSCYLQVEGKRAELCFVGQEKVAFLGHRQLLGFQFRAYKSCARTSGRLGGGPWKGIRVNWNDFCHWLGQYTLPSGFPLNFKQISVQRGNVLHMFLMPLFSIHKKCHLLREVEFPGIVWSFFFFFFPLKESNIWIATNNLIFLFKVIGGIIGSDFWFLLQMALNAFSPNLLKSPILKYGFLLFQHLQVFCFVHFQVYLNLIEVNKILKGSTIFISGKKVTNREHCSYLLTASKCPSFSPFPASLWRPKPSLRWERVRKY